MLRLQPDYTLQGINPVPDRLPRQSGHQVDINIVKSRLTCGIIIFQKIPISMDASKPLQLLIMGRLKANAKAVDACGLVHQKLLAIQGFGIAFHGNFRIRGNGKIPAHRLHDFCCLRPWQDRRRAAAQENGYNLIVLQAHGLITDFLYQRSNIKPADILLRRHGQEITITAFPDTKWDMDV